MKKILLYVSTALLLTGCTFGPQFDVDFSELDSHPEWFQVTQRSTTDLGDGIPSNCYFMDGLSARDVALMPEFNLTEAPEDMSGAPARTSSTTAANIVQNLFNYSQNSRVIELAGTYYSVDLDGNRIRLSGKVVMPANGKAKCVILVSHYTIGSNAEAPSNAFPLEGVLAHLGYVLIFPDYLGYGVTGEYTHPYLVLEQTARNEADMLFAVMPFLEAAGVELEYPDGLMLMGYSQGGANTMALLHFLETSYPDRFYIHRVFAGGGPYDVLETYQKFVRTDVADYPVAVPLVLQGMIKGNRLDLQIPDLVQPWLYEHFDEWINSLQYTTGQVNEFINTKRTSAMLTELGMDLKSEKVSELYKAMTNNSILSYDWTPKAPIYMFHSIDDETVTFLNASRARDKWTDANIQYNFGNYGTHQMGCLRFIFSVRTLLKEEYKSKNW